MRKSHVMNLLQFAVVIAAIAASVFYRHEIGYLIVAWTAFILFSMGIQLFFCKMIMSSEDPRYENLMKLKYKIFSKYIEGQHLPAVVDTILYAIIIFFSGFYGMLFTATAWLGIAYCDLRMRSLAEEVNNDIRGIVAFIAIKKALEEKYK